MKCEHGKEITVNIEKEDRYCWDDGIIWYDEHGKYHNQGDIYISVSGCDICSFVRAKIY